MRNTVHIFLADDDLDDQVLMKEAFSEVSEAVSFEFFENGRVLVDRINAGVLDGYPDLIVLDYNMPLMNGLDALMALQQISDWSDVPKVIWSTSRAEKMVADCMENGAAAYYRKPNDFAEYCRIAADMLSMAVANKVK
ncbi:Response regulator receiver domain-containing protein [Chitinophaga jiangningensis]|uniref:Response regulator receiver domain-containing protein n=1 Tax=Chitinophaga jiangningensis TaxID=1419482 RepID=A0A1M6ZYF7_9BACT|nr:response regulator [Chitinophaga jiangningensis]SHL35521.1 Response regulator receiver domain-containing protein [Chitinophaga jiangningensis]